MASWLDKVFENAKQGHTEYDVRIAEDLENHVNPLVAFLRENNFKAEVTYQAPGQKAVLEVSRDGYSGAFDVMIAKTPYARTEGKVLICKAGDMVRDSRESYEYFRSDSYDAYADYRQKKLGTYIARTIVENSQPEKRVGFFKKLGLS